MSRFRRRTAPVVGAVAALVILLTASPAALGDSSPLVTRRPNLVAAEAISPTQVLACFDQILATPIAFTDSSFYLQGFAETRKTGAAGGLSLSSEASTGGGLCVLALFTGTGDATTYERLVVLAGAVNAAVVGGGGAVNVQSSVALFGSPHAGATSGPDLTSFTINPGNGMVSFVFDEPVSSTAVVPQSFRLVDSSGALTVPPSQASACLLGSPPAPQYVVSANTVAVNFSSPTCGLINLLPGPPNLGALRGVVGVTVDEGAVADATAVVNPLASLGVTPAPVPPGPTPRPPPTPAPTPLPPGPAPTKPKPKICHRVVTLHLLSSVSRNLTSATVTVNGKKVAVSKKLTVTIPFAGYPGSKSIVVKVKGKLKNHRSLTRTRTYRNTC